MTMKELHSQQATMQSDFEAARSAAEVIADQESEALANDEAYISWTRRKKLAEREVARLQAALATLADEIVAEEGRQNQEALQKRYKTTKAHNEALQARLASFRDVVIPDLLRLMRDLAEDEINVQAINRLVPWEHRLRTADSVVRCAVSVPASSETGQRARLADDTAPLWKSIVLPRLTSRGAPLLFDGSLFHSPQSVIVNLNQKLSDR